jgi:hypothetical protein
LLAVVEVVETVGAMAAAVRVPMVVAPQVVVEVTVEVDPVLEDTLLLVEDRLVEDTAVVEVEAVGVDVVEAWEAVGMVDRREIRTGLERT